VREKNTPTTVNVLRTIIIVVWLLVVMAVAVRSCGFNAIQFRRSPQNVSPASLWSTEE
jgi:hypothetical protein